MLCVVILQVLLYAYAEHCFTSKYIIVTVSLTTPSHTHIQHSCKYVGLSWLSPKGNVGLGLYPHGPLTIDAHRLTDRYAALFPKAYPARRFGRVCVCVCVRQSKGLPGSGL